jgi:hypothetical protein
MATIAVAVSAPAVLTPAAIAGPTPKRCGSPLSGVTHLRAATGIACALAQRVVRTREQRGKPPAGWNCSYAKKISGSRYYSKYCKLGLASGGAIIRYWVLNPTAYSGAALQAPKVSASRVLAGNRYRPSGRWCPTNRECFSSVRWTVYNRSRAVGHGRLTQGGAGIPTRVYRRATIRLSGPSTMCGARRFAKARLLGNTYRLSEAFCAVYLPR